MSTYTETKEFRAIMKNAALHTKMMERKQKTYEANNSPVVTIPANNTVVYGDGPEQDTETEYDDYDDISSHKQKKTTAPTGVHPMTYFNSEGIFDIRLYSRQFIMYENSHVSIGGSRFERFEKKYHADDDNDTREYIIKQYNKMKCNDPTRYVDDLEMIPIMMQRSKKIPVMSGWQKTTKGSVDLDGWKRNDPEDMNVAVLSGYASNIFVIDIDKPKDGETWGLEWLSEQYIKDCTLNKTRYKYPGRADHFADTLVQESGSGGLHLFYEYEPVCDIFSTAARNAVVQNGKTYSIDIKSNGGNITMTPSLHASGKNYRFLDNLEGQQTHCVPKFMPLWLVNDLIIMMMRNNYPFKHIRTDDIVTFDQDGKRVTPEMKFEKRASAKFDSTTLSSSDTVYKCFLKLNPQRWSNYTNWEQMIVLLSNLSIREKEPNKYYKLACQLSATSSKWDEDSKKILDKRWDISNVEYPYGFKRMMDWLKSDLGTKKMYNDFLSEIGIFKRNEDYEWMDHMKFCDVDFSPSADPDGKEMNKVWDFMYATLAPIVGDTVPGLIYVCKHKRFDPTYQKEYVEYSYTNRAKLDGILKGVNLQGAKRVVLKDCVEYRDLPLIKMIDAYRIKNPYSKVVFTPYSAKSLNRGAAIDKSKYKTFNMFGGFCNNYDPDFVVDRKLLAPIFEVISNLCNDNEEYLTYFIKWLAHIVQHPNTKTDVIVSIKSEQGAGKTTFFNWFGAAVLGNQYYASVSDMGKITGQFNTIIAGKLLVAVEEADTFEGNYTVVNKLKDLCTNTKQTIEYKCQNAIVIDDYVNYAILTNRERSVRVESGDRRYFCLEALRKYEPGDPFWTMLGQLYANPASSEHFFHYLMGVPVHKTDLLKIPNTETRVELIQHNARPIVEYGLSLYREKFFDDDGVRNDVNEILLLADDVYQGCCDVLRDRGRPITVNKSSLGKELKEYYGDNGRVNIYGPKIGRSKLQQYIITFDNLERVLRKHGFANEL